MAAAVSTAVTVAGLVETCVKLLHKLHQSYEKYSEHKEKIDSAEKELQAMDRAIKNSSAAADDDGDGWIIGLEEIKREIEDSIDHYNFKVMCKSDGQGYLGLIPRGVDLLSGPRKKLLQDIENIYGRIKQMNMRAQRYQQAGKTTAGTGTAGGKPTAYQHPRVPDPEGLETSTEELVRMMRSKDSKRLLVVAISGPGGSGKSVLAEAMYRRVEKDFNRRAWVTATSCNTNDILNGIARQLRFEQPPPAKDAGTHLREQLIGHRKRYIIVIEEIESKSYWDILENAFPDGKSNIRIIVTTRAEDVAQHCSKHSQAYKMQALDLNSASNLLLNKALSVRSVRPSSLDEGLIKILETCEYLPVAIANMGAYMKKKGIPTRWNKHNCEEICKDIGSLLVNNAEEAFTGVKHVFDSSYTSLSYGAKNCLLSLISVCSDVEEKGVIRRKSVIRQWLAERLIEGTNTQSAENLANECFTTLVNLNFIIPVKVSINAKIKTFRVHRMMLPFIQDKAISRRFVTRLDIHRGKKVEPHASTIRLCLHNSSSDHAMSREAIDLGRIRLLTFRGKASNSLKNFKSTVFLRVLVLENIENLKDGDLDAFCIQSMLKYLSIRGNKGVTKLPKNIVELRMLETLDTRGTKVHKISMDVILLPELLRLLGEFEITNVMSKRERVQSFILPKDNIRKANSRRKRLLNKLVPQNNNITIIENSKLQTLAGLLIDESSDFVTLLHLMPMLSKVTIMCRKTTPSEKVIHDLLSCLKSCLEKEVKDGGSPIYSLSIDFRGCDLIFLDGLKIRSPSPCVLRSLKLRGKLTKLPEFILSLSGSLGELCLLDTNLGVSVLSRLRCLENLQFLKLTEHPEFEEHTYDELVFQHDWFYSLKRICLDVPKIPKIVIKERAVECIESLQLFCRELGGFSGILHLKGLKEVILPTHVSGVEVDRLLQQVGNHSMKPNLLYDDGSSRPMGASEL